MIRRERRGDLLAWMPPGCPGLIEAEHSLTCYCWAEMRERSEFAAYISAPPLPLLVFFQSSGARRFCFNVNFISHFFFHQP
jgi:hypothetical protein